MEPQVHAGSTLSESPILRIFHLIYAYCEYCEWTPIANRKKLS